MFRASRRQTGAFGCGRVAVYSAETARDKLTSAFNRTLKYRRIFKLDFLIGLLELDSILNHPIVLLSAGERQRVALASSLLQ